MAKWQRYLHLNPEWQQVKDDKTTVQQLAAVIANRLRELEPFPQREDHVNEKRDEIAEEFEYLASLENVEASEFEYWMDELFDWGDMALDRAWNGKKVCWIDANSHGDESVGHEQGKAS